MERLNIFVDETGEFGFGIGASELYGVSFTFHEQNDNITPELNKLNDRLNKIGYTNMIHMADLIMKRNDYSKIPINKRKSIFNSIYQFSRRIPVKYKTIIIDKKYTDNGRILRQKLSLEINNMVKEHEKYFNKFDKIVMYYDNGQEVLGTILDAIFSQRAPFIWGMSHVPCPMSQCPNTVPSPVFPIFVGQRTVLCPISHYFSTYFSRCNNDVTFNICVP